MKNRKVFIVLISIILFLLLIITFFLKSKEIMFSSNMKKGIEKYWKNKVVIKEVKDFEAYGKKFRIVLSVSVNNEKYKYLNCYEEKLNGLFYRSYQASEQGGSRALLNFSTIHVNNVKDSNKENWITVVYGYNKDLLVDNYEMKINGHEKNIISSIKGKEYFVDVYKGSFKELVSASGKDGSDMLNTFSD